VEFNASHMSRVIFVRTKRALVRAALRQEWTDEGFLSSNRMKPTAWSKAVSP
jgi:hypothetical protein